MIKLDLIFKIIWGLALGLFIFILYTIAISSWNEIKSLLVPLGVLISAMLASVSVMKSIDNTNKIEVEKIKRELYDRRKKVIFIIFNLWTKLQLVEDKKNTSKPYFLELKFIDECMDTIKDSYFIFDNQDYVIIKPIFDNILELINYSFILNDMKNNISNKNFDQDIKEIYRIQTELLAYIKKNLNSLKASIKITKNT